ncbi:MAG: ribonuclease M5 [Peptoniphilaceae bacterium]|nr:ribonuclease M5 [Peptoniphilaceae bacterium]MDY6146539.1 ribonuclease M5 [Peptoniphilaceae bacterium]
MGFPRKTGFAIISEKFSAGENMIQEIIVVEGKDDISAVKRAVDCECIMTHGHGFGESLLDELEILQERRGLIILTDPDYAGKKIRRRIRERIPGAKHAFLDQKEALRGENIGVENASPEAIRKALKRARATITERRDEFQKADLYAWGLDGSPYAKERRSALSSALCIGYGNAKQLLARLNEYGITREEFEQAMQAIDAKRSLEEA